MPRFSVVISNPSDDRCNITFRTIEFLDDSVAIALSLHKNCNTPHVITVFDGSDPVVTFSHLDDKKNG